MRTYNHSFFGMGANVTKRGFVGSLAAGGSRLAGQAEGQRCTLQHDQLRLCFHGLGMLCYGITAAHWASASRNRLFPLVIGGGRRATTTRSFLDIGFFFPGIVHDTRELT